MDSWESKLLELAYSGLNSHKILEPVNIDKHRLRKAYNLCKALTKRNSRTFYLSSSVLPPKKRRAIRALYAFCRATDDIVDLANEDPREQLMLWKQRALSVEPSNNDLLITAWLDTRARYSIPEGYVEQLIDGIASDIYPCRYYTFDELTEYCYKVAVTVGLMVMHIIGFRGNDAFPYAIKLGVALQLTNILRDIGEDWKLGRLYLPVDELAEFNITESDIDAGTVDERWRAFMKYQISRCHRLYAEALPGISMLHSDGHFAIAAAAELYRAILGEIEKSDYNVFVRRAHVSSLRKLMKLPGIWYRTKIMAYQSRCQKRHTKITTTS